MKYANQDKTAVITSHPISGQEWTVPQGHRFWQEWGIDQAQARGEIADAEIIDIDNGSGGNSASNG